ncbi:site-specific integrase [Rhodanobacter sp. 7MK24]|uniref:site-specific integrase n=1 Tax=Rhodanobacter sp. 7MK24 TaxID=2775922 RepID=UPI0017833BC9|nr:site-specific integrase [Rhodanobacter sp. 7MK24]MBD8881857.1 site-specific integrase [Rhodanobacter sp. 7MK24]
MSYLVMTPDRSLLTRAGYGAVAHIPFLMCVDGSYPALANRYVRARALCEWWLRLGTSGEKVAPTRKFQTAKSCISLVRRLKAFLEWVESSGQNLAVIEYDQLLTWQTGLLDGSLSASGAPLSHSTINLYVSEACYYLTWLSLVPRDAAGRPVRGPFDIVTRDVNVRTHHGRSTRSQTERIEIRLGNLQPIPPHSIDLPSSPDVARWMRAFRARAPVKALMAEAILDSGLRISEVNHMEVGTLPARTEWKPVDGRVFFFINKGVKGRKVTPDSPIAVRGRYVSLSLQVAQKIDDYRHFTRETQLRRWIRSGADKAERARRAGARPVRLWLSEHSHQPFANQQLFHAWTTLAACPKGWHPHSGRAWYAVEALVAYARLAQASRQGQATDLTWLEGVMRNQVDLLIRPTLGHLSVDTTHRYIRAALFRLTELIGAPTLRWQDLMDGDDEEV